MKKILIGLLFVVGCTLSASAYTVAIQLDCGKTVMTDDSNFATKADMDAFREVMNEVHC